MKKQRQTKEEEVYHFDGDHEDKTLDFLKSCMSRESFDTVFY